jgi:hypothetical protein
MSSGTVGGWYGAVAEVEAAGPSSSRRRKAEAAAATAMLTSWWWFLVLGVASSWKDGKGPRQALLY